MPTDTAPKNTVVQYVGVKAVRKLKKQESVYNMTVDDTHNYSVAGGYIMHNCDSARYFCKTMHVVQKARKKGLIV